MLNVDFKDFKQISIPFLKYTVWSNGTNTLIPTFMSPAQYDRISLKRRFLFGLFVERFRENVSGWKLRQEGKWKKEGAWLVLAAPASAQATDAATRLPIFTLACSLDEAFLNHTMEAFPLIIKSETYTKSNLCLSLNQKENPSCFEIFSKVDYFVRQFHTHAKHDLWTILERIHCLSY